MASGGLAGTEPSPPSNVTATFVNARFVIGYVTPLKMLPVMSAP